MNSSRNPMDVFRPSGAKPVEERWCQGKQTVRTLTHYAIRWIQNFFFLRPFDGVRISLTPLDYEEGTSHRKESVWRILGSTKARKPGGVPASAERKAEYPLTDDPALRSAQESLHQANAATPIAKDSIGLKPLLTRTGSSVKTETRE